MFISIVHSTAALLISLGAFLLDKERMNVSPISIILSIAALLVSLGTFLLALLPRYRGVKYRIRSGFLGKTGIKLDFEFINLSSIPHNISRIQLWIRDIWLDCHEWGNAYISLVRKTNNNPPVIQKIKSASLPIQLNIYGASSTIVSFDLKRDYPHPIPKTWEEFFKDCGNEGINSVRFRIVDNGRPRIVTLQVPDVNLVRRAFPATIRGSRYLSD